MGEIKVVVGGQFGSEGKGHVTAWLAKQAGHRDMCVRVAGPNAGHSAIGTDGNKWALRQVPIAAVVNPDVGLVIAAGSEIDPEVLADEVTRLEAAGFEIRSRLYIDFDATVITAGHREAETSLVTRIGSTGKGIGAARADRIMRQAPTWADWVASEQNAWTTPLYHTPQILHGALSGGRTVIIEGTQGYGLGLHTNYYPKTTSSDCRAIDFLGMAGLSPWAEGVDISIWPVFRTHPIRVAGNSGPLYDELTWDQLSHETNGYIQPEHTTVTQKVRRVGRWDPVLAVQAMKANGGPSPKVFPILTFLDYVFPEVSGIDNGAALREHNVQDFLNEIELDLMQPLAGVGTGPDTIVRL